ncbi:Hypothetical protein A7982_09085 [Minicystis rosea]|nr:Hypothetical protein A7982_09085 [Minicystis rosea]
MSAPKRWLFDEGDAGSAEQDLLRAGLSLEPPPNAQDDVWAALLAKLPPPPGGPPGDGGSSAGAAGKAAATGKAAVLTKATGAAGAAVGAGILKSALIGAGSAVALIATYSVVTPSAPEAPRPAIVAAPPVDDSHVKDVPVAPRAEAQPAVTASSSPSAEPTSERRSEPRANVKAPASASAEPPPVAVDRETMLREESRLLAEARAALRRGDPGGALAMLEQIRTKFPGGMLVQEREALAIEALARSGRKGEAAARADAFVKAYPSSPLAARVQQLAN